jgi:hypothetical protein
MRSNRWFYCIFAAVAAASAGPVGRAREIGSFDRTLTVNGVADLNVETGSGHIAVRPGSGNTVKIHATISAGDWAGPDVEQRAREIASNPPIRESGNSISIGHLENDEGRNLSISYEIEAPPSSSVRARTGSGGETFDGIEGTLNAMTGSGGIRVSRAGSDVRLMTGSGTIDLDGGKGSVDAQTGSGGIRISNVSGPVRAQTGSGGVSVDLPSAGGFDLRAHTGSGRVEVGPAMTTQNFSSGRHYVEGRIRGGGPLLDLTTGSGSVRVN